MVQNIASGLHYLHCIFDPRIKPRIAHRDLKSSNILIGADLQCCIGDLGLAICDIGWSNASLTSCLTRKSNIQVGTKRYMAPELLSLTFNEKCHFHNLK
ncbi:hypothetical protein MXB_1985 [Myxobolus squamalis]|nr:hypothetical protein MXB_1985 [Myxobolus squamalis]